MEYTHSLLLKGEVKKWGGNTEHRSQMGSLLFRHKSVNTETTFKNTASYGQFWPKAFNIHQNVSADTFLSHICQCVPQ